MTFKVTLASDFNYAVEWTFNSLEELNDFAKSEFVNHCSLVINFERRTIIIYDDYIE